MPRRSHHPTPLSHLLAPALLLAACTDTGDRARDAMPSDAMPADATPTDARPADATPTDASADCRPRWPDAPWHQTLDAAPVDPDSDAIIAALRDAGGWGNGDRFQIDFSIEVLTAPEGTPLRAFTPSDDHYTPDCDHDPIPVPPGGALEGEDGYRCDNDGDCHLIVWQPSTGLLYEMWRAHIDGDTFRGGCLAIWDSARVYRDRGRGRDCTSADAAGLPIAPLLFGADEVAAGRIDHAIRFVLPNDRIAHRTYVAPATHATGAASAPRDIGVPYGARLRLRADFPIDTLSPGARVVARALQRHGMILAEGGQIALTARSDRFEATRWDGLLGPHDLASLRVEHFEVIERGVRYDWQGDCVRAEPALREGVCPPGPRP